MESVKDNRERWKYGGNMKKHDDFEVNSFRGFLERLKKDGELYTVKKEKEVSTYLEVASLLSTLEKKTIVITKSDKKFRIAGNVFSRKKNVAKYFNCTVEELNKKLIDAMNNPEKPKLVNYGTVLENTIENDKINLGEIPVPTYLKGDGGPYFTSAIIIANDKKYGRNLSFHRLMVINRNEVVARILNRHLNKFIKFAEDKGEDELDIAIIVGSPINVLLAGAMSLEIGEDELSIANSLSKIETVKLSNGIEIPNNVEFAFEGKITKKTHKEGPFLDLTGTYDIVREQRIIKITKIYHRNNPIFHALLPGGLEHKILMGMPKEPIIFKRVNEICECNGVNISHGGCSWLHAIISINKKNEEDGKKAIEVAFEAHKSLKHVIVVDKDINPNRIEEVEWAIATRFQASQDLVVKKKQYGSSLDPSADQNTYLTSKMGLDATKPIGEHKEFEKMEYEKINVKEYFNSNEI